jgi:nitric oxide reductase activation protein
MHGFESAVHRKLTFCSFFFFLFLSLVAVQRPQQHLRHRRQALKRYLQMAESRCSNRPPDRRRQTPLPAPLLAES